MLRHDAQHVDNPCVMRGALFTCMPHFAWVMVHYGVWSYRSISKARAKPPQNLTVW